MVKNRPVYARNLRVLGSTPGLERSPEGNKATCSSILAWEVPWAEEPGAAKSWIRLRARTHTHTDTHTQTHTHRHRHTHRHTHTDTHTHRHTHRHTHTHISFEQEKFQLVLYRLLHPALRVTLHPGMLAFSVAPRLPGVPSTVSRMKCPQGE